MAYDGRLLRLAQERYEADRTRREAELAAQREEIYARRPRLREIQEQLRRTASRVMAAALRRGQDPRGCGRKISACRRSGGSFYRSWACRRTRWRTPRPVRCAGTPGSGAASCAAA